MNCHLRYVIFGVSSQDDLRALTRAMEADMIGAIFKQAVLTFDRRLTAHAHAPAQLDLLRHMLADLSKDHLQTRPDLCDLRDLAPHDEGRGGAPCTYVEICENELFSMSVFIVKAGRSLPLHDHPGMTGLIKVLAGKLSVTSYSREEDGDGGDPSEDSVYDRTVMARLSGRGVCTPESAPCLLTPHASNFHEIRAVDGPAAFFDILAPPYRSLSETPEGGEPRECRYYRAEEASPEGLCRLREIPVPSWFFCDRGTYFGPPPAPLGRTTAPR